MTIIPAGTEVEYTVTWLEMTARPDWGWPPQPVGDPAALVRAEQPPVWYFFALYDAVGRDYSWEDLHAEPEQWVADWFADERVELWSLHRNGWPHGFFVLDARESDVTDLAFFGLVPQAVGAGLGKFLLRTAILTAWQREGLKKLTVNTCTLDHPRALQTYQKNGFTPIRREDRKRTLTRDRDLSRIPD